MIINYIQKDNINLINLIPDDGKVLVKDNIYSFSVYLGINDSIKNWEEIDANLIKEAQEGGDI